MLPGAPQPEAGSTPVQEPCVRLPAADWPCVLRELWPILFPKQQRFGASLRCHRVKTPRLLQARHASQLDDRDLSVHLWVLTFTSLLSKFFGPRNLIPQVSAISRNEVLTFMVVNG